MYKTYRFAQKISKKKIPWTLKSFLKSKHFNDALVDKKKESSMPRLWIYFCLLFYSVYFIHQVFFFTILLHFFLWFSTNSNTSRLCMRVYVMTQIQPSFFTIISINKMWWLCLSGFYFKNSDLTKWKKNNYQAWAKEKNDNRNWWNLVPKQC